MSGSIGKGITGIIDQISFPDFASKDYRERLFDNITFLQIRNRSGGSTTSTALYYQWILNLQQLLIRLLILMEEQ
jgi:hypothetical protein